jgi:hypothetical protein
MLYHISYWEDPVPATLPREGHLEPLTVKRAALQLAVDTAKKRGLSMLTIIDDSGITPEIVKMTEYQEVNGVVRSFPLEA